MLDAFVIEEIKRRERGREERPVVQLPVPVPNHPAESEHRDDGGKPEEPGRGVVIIDYTG